MNTAYGGTPVEVLRRGRSYVTTVNSEYLQRLETAAAVATGFLRLAARGAQCYEYSERAEDLLRLLRAGSVRLPQEIEDAISAAERHTHTTRRRARKEEASAA